MQYTIGSQQNVHRGLGIYGWDVEVGSVCRLSLTHQKSDIGGSSNIVVQYTFYDVYLAST
jgi:hypothetical protein